MRIGMILGLATVLLTSTVALPIQQHAGDSNQESHVALERRTNGPPGDRLNPTEYAARMRRVQTQVAEAFAHDRTMQARVARILGLEPEILFEIDVPPDRMNAALTEAGYKGELLPEREIQEYMDQSRWVLEQIQMALERDPALKRRFHAALGLPLRNSWLQGPRGRRILNKALRDAGYPGPYLPEDPGYIYPSDQGGGSDRPDRFSINEGAPASGFVPRVMQFVPGVMQSLGKALGNVRSMNNPAGSPSPPHPLLPILQGPLSPVGGI
ncbi:MAG: hypothetical protein M1816_008211 [Peltula sp. TS41687]|nr:MAG: hypothetical protein M1816_008211 [Peltula sp. TS41687]